MKKIIAIATLVAATSASAGFFNNNDNGSNWGPFDSGSNMGPFNGASNWGPFSGAQNWMNDTDFGFNFNTKNKIDNRVAGKADAQFAGQAEAYAKGYADATKKSNMNFFASEQQAMLNEQRLD
jgi:hypothetical protein